ncbi:MAG: D-alanyl-D-alanine carboxypeptidase/D-alanyl-D-alanine-endopeptidase [Planctomycetes bacterium]|nr:D-alanyl-D-alanine carboxypeptidase/D-alanyl-D-alanine-endopeptidase [Planctomycetota bacterium]
MASLARLRFTNGVLLIWCAAAGWGPRLLGGPLEDRIRSILRGARCRQEGVAVAVVDEEGRKVAGVSSDRPMIPASNMKILTTLAALRLLGLDYEYETRIVSRAALLGGEIAGDVIVHSTGDPNISGRFYDGEPDALFRRWARELVQAGLRTIRGDIIADDSFFDDVRFLPGWQRKNEGRWFSAQVSSLNLNDNCLDVRIVPTEPGRKARVEVKPLSDFIEIEGAPMTAAGGPSTVLIHRATGTNRVTFKGNLPARRDALEDWVAIDDPALFFVHTLARVLRREGIEITGEIRRERGAFSRWDEKQGPVLVKHRSSLKVDLPVINKRSQNLHAEVLLKTLGARKEGEGSVEAGGRAIRRFLEAEGIAASGLVVADGSGLSRENRVTSDQLARLLHAARGTDAFTAFLDSLPVGGEDGTLAKRFRDGPGRALRGRVHAKTGYISGVYALSGYLEREGRLWSFSMLFNQSGGQLHPWDIQDRVLLEIDREMARDPGPAS